MGQKLTKIAAAQAGLQIFGSIFRKVVAIVASGVARQSAFGVRKSREVD
jgi:hypothetical protein